eukprot:GHVP01025189.1.p1 GENE.GHVP01025189.1~~GHVP01025189.1.p1  ORF type:complete len:356 (+),score=47.91 GHVP01025189.1:321-1388(+)
MNTSLEECSLNELVEKGENQRFLDEKDTILSIFREINPNKKKREVLKNIQTVSRNCIIFSTRLRAYGVIDEILEEMTPDVDISIALEVYHLIVIVFEGKEDSIAYLSSSGLCDLCNLLFSNNQEEKAFFIIGYIITSHRKVKVSEMLNIHFILYFTNNLFHENTESEKALCYLEYVSSFSSFIDFFHDRLPIFLEYTIDSLNKVSHELHSVVCLRILLNITGRDDSSLFDQKCFTVFVIDLIEYLVNICLTEETEGIALITMVLINIIDANKSHLFEERKKHLMYLMSRMESRPQIGTQYMFIFFKIFTRINKENEEIFKYSSISKDRLKKWTKEDDYQGVSLSVKRRILEEIRE